MLYHFLRSCRSAAVGVDKFAPPRPRSWQANSNRQGGKPCPDRTGRPLFAWFIIDSSVASAPFTSPVASSTDCLVELHSHLGESSCTGAIRKPAAKVAADPS